MDMKRPLKTVLTVVALFATGAALAVVLFKKGGSKMDVAKMKISDNGLDLIKQFEGLRTESYQCQAGVWTIGYGHTKGVTSGMKITKEQAEQYLKQDITTFENAVRNTLKGVSLTQSQFDALVSFSFNIGTTKFKNSTLVSKVKANPDDTSIADEFRKWKYANGAVSKGLLNRREREAQLYFA
jgi:lysozyme